MKCPKCGYHSFDHLESCKKCGQELSQARRGLSTRISPVARGQESPESPDKFSPPDVSEPFAEELSAGSQPEQQPLSSPPPKEELPAGDPIPFSLPAAGESAKTEEPPPDTPDTSSRTETLDEIASGEDSGVPNPVEAFLASLDEGDVCAASYPKLAPRGRCVLAAGVDLGLLTVVFLVFMMIGEMGFTVGTSGRLLPAPTELLELSVPYFLVFFTLSFGYFTLFHYLSGQTPGKMIMGIRVEGVEGETLLFSQAFLRSVGGLLSLLPFGAGYLLALTAPGKRGWNDLLAATRIVNVEPGAG